VVAVTVSRTSNVMQCSEPTKERPYARAHVWSEHTPTLPRVPGEYFRVKRCRTYHARLPPREPAEGIACCYRSAALDDGAARRRNQPEDVAHERSGMGLPKPSGQVLDQRRAVGIERFDHADDVGNIALNWTLLTHPRN